MTETTIWLALVLLGIPVVLLLATAGCGISARGELEPEVVSQVPDPPPNAPAEPSPTPAPTPPPGPQPLGYVQTVLATPGLIGYWRLGEQQVVLAAPDPKAVNSFTPAVHDGSYRAPTGITLEQAGALAPKDLDTAARLAGSGGHVEVANHPTLTPAEVSVELWIKVDAAAPDWRVLVGCYEADFTDNQVTRGYRLRARTAPAQGTPTAIQVQGAFGGIGTPLQTEVPFGSGWHHVVFAYHTAPLGQEMAVLYLDDKVASVQRKCDVVVGNPQPLRFGANTTLFAPTTFKGALDEIALYGQALPKTTVEAHRAAG